MISLVLTMITSANKCSRAKPQLPQLLAVYSTDLAAVLCADQQLHGPSVSEQQQAAQYATPTRQQQFLAGRALIRAAVTQLKPQVSNQDIVIVRASNGAPELMVQGQRWHCSISHTEGAALVGVSASHAMGVDIERSRAPKQLPLLLKRFADGFLAGLSATVSTSEFSRRWTLAEAVTKYQQGLLMRTLQQPFDVYQAAATWHQVAVFQLAIYHPDLPAEKLYLVDFNQLTE